MPRHAGWGRRAKPTSASQPHIEVRGAQGVKGVERFLDWLNERRVEELRAKHDLGGRGISLREAGL